MLKRVGLSLVGGVLLAGQGVYAQSEAQPIAQIAQAEDSLERENQLEQQFLRLYRAGQYQDAIAIGQEVLSIREQELGANHPHIATSLNNLAALYQIMGRYTEAEPLFQRALSIREKELGANHLRTATSLNNLAALYESMGRYTEAELLFLRALSIREQELGVNHPNTATSLNNLALLYRATGRYTEAETYLQQALAIREQKLGVNHPDTAQSLNNLAELYREMGRYAEAEPILRRALVIFEQELGVNHSNTATSLNNLALLYRAIGRFTEVEPLLQRALAIVTQDLGASHPYTAASLNNLADLYKVMGRYEEAESLYKRTLAIREQELGVNHPLTAQSLDNLAGLYRMGRHEEAESLYKRALAIREQKLGVNHPDTAHSLNNLAFLYHFMGRYEEAKPLYQRTFAVFEEELGANHPTTAITLNNLAGLYWITEPLNQAVKHFTQGLDIEERNLEELLVIGSEHQKQQYFQTTRFSTNRVISLNLQTAPTNPEAGELALQTILRRKGRILDAVSNNIQLLRDNLTPQNQRLLDNLSTKRTELAAALFNPPANITDSYRDRIATLKGEAEQLETQLARASDEFRIETEPITIESIQTLIPTDAALIEIVHYRPFDPKTNEVSDPHYAAYILPPNGDPTWLDLGPAEPINTAAQALRRELDNPNDRLAAKRRGRELDAMVMEPIRAKLGNAQHLLISPDSQLNLIPFAALVNENDQYLLETHQITYLTTGRDLKRLQLNQQPQSPPLIVADPDYGQSKEGTSIANNRSAQRSQDIANLQFGDLPGTAAEAAALTNILPNATVLTRNNATENAIKQAQAPEILHIATHGFFLADVEQVAAPDWEMRGLIDVLPRPGSTPRPRGPVENPLLRSGLALAGFNPRQSGAEDGALTALEVASLNLRGTQLVILSACETGVGEVANGEGVYGLRRSLTIAGSESQVISLWKVADEETKELMVDYYQRLQQGGGRSDALRQVQLEMAQGVSNAHPYYWAAFIPSGDWRPMSQ